MNGHDDSEWTSYDDYLKLFLSPTCGGHCGATRYGITLIPHEKFTICHRGIFDSYVDYCNNLHNRSNFHDLSAEFYNIDNSDKWIFNKEQWFKMYNLLGNLCTKKHHIWTTDLVNTVQNSAFAGIIDEKYQDRNNIIPTIPVLLTKSCCIQDSLILTGSWVTAAWLEVPLLYNGALDIVLDELNKLFDTKNKERKRIL